MFLPIRLLFNTNVEKTVGNPPNGAKGSAFMRRSSICTESGAVRAAQNQFGT
jgi:hypothetical protein